MGRTAATVQLHGMSPDGALALAAAAFAAEGWRSVDRAGPRSVELGAALSGGWVNLLLPRGWSARAVERIAATSGLAGIHLYVVDSDFWGGLLFRDGAVVRRFETRKRVPGARLLRRQIAAALGIEVPESSLAAVLAMKPVYAEEALDAFARLLGMNEVLALPEGAATLLLERPASSMEAALTGLFDMRAHALVLAPAPGFGAAVMALLRLVAERAGGRSAPRRVIVERGAIHDFADADMADIAARLDAGAIDSVDVDFDGLSFNCRRHGLAGRQLQIVAPGLLTAAGKLARPDKLGLLDPSERLLACLFAAPRATAGLIDPVASDTVAAADDLRTLTAWPPVAHWISYLAPDIARALDGAALARAAAAGWTFTEDAGGWLARLALPAHLSRDATGAQARALLTAALAGLPLPDPT